MREWIGYTIIICVTLLALTTIAVVTFEVAVREENDDDLRNRVYNTSNLY